MRAKRQVRRILRTGSARAGALCDALWRAIGAPFAAPMPRAGRVHSLSEDSSLTIAWLRARATVDRATAEQTSWIRLRASIILSNWYGCPLGVSLHLAGVPVIDVFKRVLQVLCKSCVQIGTACSSFLFSSGVGPAVMSSA